MSNKVLNNGRNLNLINVFLCESVTIQRKQEYNEALRMIRQKPFFMVMAIICNVKVPIVTFCMVEVRINRFK